MHRAVLIGIVLAAVLRAQDAPKLYNTAKAKLAAGQPLARRFNCHSSTI